MTTSDVQPASLSSKVRLYRASRAKWLLLALFVTAAWAVPLREAIAAEKTDYQPASQGGGELREIDGIPVLILRGNPQEMGRQQAALVGAAIKRLLSLPRSVLDGRGPSSTWSAAVETARTLMSRAPERHRRELETIAAALKIPEDDKAALLVANVLAELRSFESCAVLIAEPQRSSTGKLLFGRNFDFPAFDVLDRLSLVTVYHPQGYHAFASVGYPGSAGVMSGMNDAGLSLACLDSGPAKDGSARFDPQGDPMLITFRRVLEECATIDEAEKVVRDTRHTTWFNLAVCDKHRAIVLEITTKQVVARRAEDYLLACTNHFRTAELALTTDSDRYRKLSKFGSQHDRLAWTDVTHAMHEVNQGTRTLQTMVFEPDSLILHLSIHRRPASAGPFTSLHLEKLLEPAGKTPK